MSITLQMLLRILSYPNLGNLPCIHRKIIYHNRLRGTNMQPPRLPYPCLCPRSGTRTCPDRPSTLSYTKFTVTDYYIILSFQDMGGTYRRHFSDTKNAKEKGGYRKRRVPTIYIVQRTVRCSCCCSSSSPTLKAANVAAVDIC